jgi:hypothetical protein
VIPANIPVAGNFVLGSFTEYYLDGKKGEIYTTKEGSVYLDGYFCPIPQKLPEMQQYFFLPNLQYEEIEDGIKITKYTGLSYHVSIPRMTPP